MLEILLAHGVDANAVNENGVCLRNDLILSLFFFSILTFFLFYRKLLVKYLFEEDIWIPMIKQKGVLVFVFKVNSLVNSLHLELLSVKAEFQLH